MRWGPQRLEDGRVRFGIWAPDRDAVTLEIDGGSCVPMTMTQDHWFHAEIPAASGARYRFRFDPELAVADPASRQQDGSVHGWSVLTDPAAYQWEVADWRGRPWEDTVIEEIHAGALGGFRKAAGYLEQMANIGVTAVQLMPVAAFGGSRNWGYDGVLPYAVAEPYGSPDDLKMFIDRAHALGLMVFLDVVYNHFGPDGNYLGAYASGFFDEHARTPWGGAVAVSKEPVRRFFIDNALMWLNEYRIDGLRFDAVHAIGDNGFLDAMAREIRTSTPDRHIHLVLENEHNDADRLAPGLYDAQWNDDFHNVLHVLLTDEAEGYYQGFTEQPTHKLARCLAEGFVYQGQTPPGSQRPRGKPSGDLPATRFVSFLQNHDQIGNRALGERLTVLVDHDRLRAATALLILCPQIPLLFMGDTQGSSAPFVFFTDFHDELADAVREGRRGEFAAFAAFQDADAREQIPDPNAQASFEASYPSPGPDAHRWRALYRELLALRREHVVPRLRGAVGLGAEVRGDKAVHAQWRMGDGTVLLIDVNIGSDEVVFPEPQGSLLYGLGTAGAPASFRAELRQ